MMNDTIIDGGRHESKLKECSDFIKSKNIISFSYVGTDYVVSAKKENNKVEITAKGGGKYNLRDGSYFIIKYDTEDDSIFKLLQDVIDENNETRGNGHCTNVAGLPAGIGDTLNVEYDSGEKLYKYSNQCPTVTPDSVKKFYDIFHNFVKKDGYDFTSEGSNVQLFDDPDEEYVQGTWKGKHFGDDIEVTFNGNKVTISVNGKIVDEEEYTIFEGVIVPNKLKDGIEKATSYHDYEFFKVVSHMTKKNWFTITAYFVENSYSTCDLMNFDKEKPEDE